MVLFRVFNVERQCYESDLSNFFLNSEGMLFKFENQNIVQLSQTLYIVEKSTGIRDKNNKIMYQGDIVRKCAGEVGVIFWKEEHGSFYVNCYNKMSTVSPTLTIIGQLTDPNNKGYN